MYNCRWATLIIFVNNVSGLNVSRRKPQRCFSALRSLFAEYFCLRCATELRGMGLASKHRRQNTCSPARFMKCKNKTSLSKVIFTIPPKKTGKVQQKQEEETSEGGSLTRAQRDEHRKCKERWQNKTGNKWLKTTFNNNLTSFLTSVNLARCVKAVITNLAVWRVFFPAFCFGLKVSILVQTELAAAWSTKARWQSAKHESQKVAGEVWIVSCLKLSEIKNIGDT